MAQRRLTATRPIWRSMMIGWLVVCLPVSDEHWHGLHDKIRSGRPVSLMAQESRLGNHGLR